MKSIQLNGFGFVTNVEIASAITSNGSVIADCEKIRGLRKADRNFKENKSWVWVIPTDGDPLPEEIQSLLDEVRRHGPQEVSVVMGGFECADINFVASLGQADGTNDFGFAGDILVISRA